MTQFCDLGEDKCDCRKMVAKGGSQRILCSHWMAEETPEEDVHRASIANWATIPAEVRAVLVERLRKVVSEQEKGPDYLVKWARQSAQGKAIGSDNLRFHFTEGMVVRNILRQVMRDDKLPEVTYPDGNKAQNWDDFYYGALKELCDGPA